MNSNSKYKGLNVLNYNKGNNLVTSDEAVNRLTSMLEATGNRSSRRKMEKVLNKTVKLQEKAQIRANQKAFNTIERRVDDDFMYLFGIIGITMFEDYHWRESEDNEHGQITSLYERLTKKMEKYTSQGYSTDDILDHLDELTGIRLVSSLKSKDNGS